ncbi:MAG: FAD-dependent oxidoreductase [Planctomycetota bacterium]|nr:MAG: FAD-dependent oxidoreductase [Planctomycetota bacterium]
MDRRLPPADGEWIDRDAPLSFRFEGETYRGFRGDVVASALWAEGVRLLGRSFKYHRPRSLLSLAGHDANVMLADGLRTNLRGDTLPLAAGMDLTAVNTFGSLAHDWMNITETFSRMMPVGFYYKAFHTPEWLFPFHERQMRKVAGLGEISPEAEAAATPKDYAFCDLLVVGAGPAGLSAAIAAAETGLDVLLVDDQPRPGGSLQWAWRSNEAAYEKFQQLLARAESLPNLRIRSGTQAAGWYPDHWVALVDAQRMTKLRARAIVVATGCFDLPAVFQNNDLPGVMLASAAARLMHCYRVRPLQRAVVLTANRAGYQTALDLMAAGTQLAAVVDLRADGESGAVLTELYKQNVPVLCGHGIYEAVPTFNKQAVKAAVVCPLDAEGQLQTEHARRFACDGVVVGVGYSANVAIAAQAGVRFRFDETIQQLVPRELPAGVFVAGRANGRFELDAQLADGTRAGLAAASHLGSHTGEIAAVPPHAGEAPSHPFPIFAHPGKKNFVDQDEDLHLADFANAHKEGYDSIQLMKRYATVGMGPSQGKLANDLAVRILARLNGASINETGTTTSRPFYQPVPMSHLAGRRFHPQRRTPLHQWHVAQDAEMFYAGAWQRPEYYRREGTSREDCILSEAENVRQRVGMIDVSTLGKLQIRGPDAARFLEAIYTGNFANQQVGRLRYGVACDETGVVIEDGIVARLAENFFYVSATSGGAAAFYREMQRWALLLGHNVTLHNATGQLAAMNLAGPRSREVLAPHTDQDLSGEAFPYLGVREAQVAGVPALLIRVGFVGELGYEIHVPAAAAHHVWTTLFEAGTPHGIRPFGVEAQRMLRLEKGHLIVSHDTDALTNPYEADLGWAIGRRKEFFVGSRSLQIVRQPPSTRQLVGLEFAPAAAERLPEECHLIVEDGEIVGRITSIAKPSTLGYPIAMAFLRPELTSVGTQVHVRLDDGSLVPAQVVAMPFYDPENLRQREGELVAT